MTSTPSSSTGPGAAAACGPDPEDLLLPTQSQEDTDVGWSEPREPDDDDRLRQERPPHWDL